MSTSETRVYLTNLRHNFEGVLSIDCMPLSVGYMKSVMDRELAGESVASRVFAYPEALIEAMKAAPPDILMVSNYCWNEALGHHFLRVAKELNPRVLAVMGGPNIPVEPERQEAYVESRPWLDVYVVGDGDFVATDLVRRYRDADGAVEEMFREAIPSCIYRRDGGMAREPVAPRVRTLDDIPSPYLTGVLDEFFDGKLTPLVETNRGCPFTCTFCVQGEGYYTKVNYFSLERVYEELDYVGKMIHERSPNVGVLRIADPNYGMFERDVEISAHIGTLQKRYGWPTFIDATTGKNRPERIIKSLEKVGGALVLYQAIQSMDDEVLRNIKRSNIKLEAYERIVVEMSGRGLRAGAQLILGLPGETKESHLRGAYKLLDAGAEQAHFFQAMLLKGTDLESLETRRDYAFDTRYRVLPKNFGIYDGDKVFDIEEISVASNTMSFEDYLECRTYHLGLSVFINDSWFVPVLDVAKGLGVARSEWLQALVADMRADTGAVGALCAEFLTETREELFPTLDACIEFYSQDENLERLRRGEVGDNLMYKYRAICSYKIWKTLCAFVMDSTRRLLESRGADAIEDFDGIWKDLGTFVEASHASGMSAEELFAPATVCLRYDMPRWLQDGTPNGTGAYKFSTPREMTFRLSEDGEEELRKALKVWTTQLMGLSKLVTRIRVMSQQRSIVKAA
jgi:radical SAM superfamily enzyme YgiQ (UPF0313 family)